MAMIATIVRKLFILPPKFDSPFFRQVQCRKCSCRLQTEIADGLLRTSKVSCRAADCSLLSLELHVMAARFVGRVRLVRRRAAPCGRINLEGLSCCLERFCFPV